MNGIGQAYSGINNEQHSLILSSLYALIPILSNPISLTFAPMTTIIIATNRKDSASGRIGAEIQQRAQAAGKPVQVWDFNDLPQDIAFSETYGNRSAEFQNAIDTFVAPIQQLVFVVPEYNGSFPGILKLVIDAIPQKVWQDKMAFIVGVSAGAAGNLRGQEHLTGIFHYVKMHTHYFKPKLSAIQDAWDAEGNLQGRFKDQIDQLVALM
jgi:NAD(P)H-dependent FMN reductase